MTIPTHLTLFRIVLTFVVMACVFLPGWQAKTVALASFLLACFTDWLDGYLARRWHMESPFGALLDPIADKVLVIGLFLAFIQLRLVPAWMVLVIALREFLITGARLVAANRGVVLAAAKEGKHKTVSQMVSLFIILLALVIQERMGGHGLEYPLDVRLQTLIMISLWVTVALTVFSGLSFFWRHRTVLKDVASRSLHDGKHG